MFEEIIAKLIEWAVKYPVVSAIFMVVGTLRVIFKPLMSFLNTFVLATPSPKDNAWLKSFEEGKVYSIIGYVLDWFGSIKLPPKPPVTLVAPKKKK